VLEASNLIQAISRTNRVYDKEEKPFGIFRFFRKVYTMQDNLEEALRLYCEGDSVGVVVADIDTNIKEINALFNQIKRIYDRDGIKNYTRLPKDEADRQEFKKLFGNLKARLNTIRLQGGLKVAKVGAIELKWDSKSENGQKLDFDSDVYNNLQYRYGDLSAHGPRGAVSPTGAGFNINTSTAEIEMAKIDNDYLETHFKQIVPVLISFDETDETKNAAIEDLKVDFGRLTERQYRYAEMVLADIKNGVLKYSQTKKLVDYISEYMSKAVADAIHEFACRFGLDEQLLRGIIKSQPNKLNINDGRRLNHLVDSKDLTKTMAYYNESEGKCSISLHRDLKKFILEDVYEI